MRKVSMAVKVLTILFVLLLGSCSASILNKAYWGARVDDLCANEGVSELIQSVTLTYEDYPEMNVQNGLVVLPFEQFARESDPYFIRSVSEVLQEGMFDLELFRIEQTVTKRTTEETMSRRVTFGRRGGNLPLGLSSSGYTCNEPDEHSSLFSETIKFGGS